MAGGHGAVVRRRSSSSRAGLAPAAPRPGAGGGPPRAPKRNRHDGWEYGPRRPGPLFWAAILGLTVGLVALTCWETEQGLEHGACGAGKYWALENYYYHEAVLFDRLGRHVGWVARWKKPLRHFRDGVRDQTRQHWDDALRETLDDRLATAEMLRRNRAQLGAWFDDVGALPGARASPDEEAELLYRDVLALAEPEGNHSAVAAAGLGLLTAESILAGRRRASAQQAQEALDLLQQAIDLNEALEVDGRLHTAPVDLFEARLRTTTGGANVSVQPGISLQIGARTYRNWGLGIAKLYHAAARLTLVLGEKNRALDTFFVALETAWGVDVRTFGWAFSDIMALCRKCDLASDWGEERPIAKWSQGVWDTIALIEGDDPSWASWHLFLYNYTLWRMPWPFEYDDAFVFFAAFKLRVLQAEQKFNPKDPDLYTSHDQADSYLEVGNDGVRTLFNAHSGFPAADFQAPRRGDVFSHRPPPEAPFGVGLRTPFPVFVVGLPRSGANLVEDLIVRHENGTSIGRASGIGRLVAALKGELANATDTHGESALLQRYGKRYYDALQAEYARGRRGAVQGPAVDFRWSRVVDVGVDAADLGHVMAMFPDACVVEAARHPLDLGWSIFQASLPVFEYPWSWSKREIASFIKRHVELMDHWRAAFPGRILTVHYEELLARRTAPLMKRLYDHCGLTGRDGWELDLAELEALLGGARSDDTPQYRLHEADSRADLAYHTDVHATFNVSADAVERKYSTDFPTLRLSHEVLKYEVALQERGMKFRPIPHVEKNEAANTAQIWWHTEEEEEDDKTGEGGA